MIFELLKSSRTRSAAAWLLLTATVTVLLGAPNLGCDRNPSTARRSDDPASYVSTAVITEGSLGLIRIGSDREEVIRQLRMSGASTVLAGPVRVEARSSAELPKLIDADGLIIGRNEASIEFENDEVKKVHVAPIRSEWEAYLSGVRTRTETFEALEQILETAPGVVIWSTAPDTRNVRLDSPSIPDMARLERYPIWESGYRDDDGLWHLELAFDEGELVRIEVKHSRIGLP